MKNVRNVLAKLSAAVKPLAIAAVCALLVFASAAPAMAFGNSSSKPSDGVVELDSVQNKSEDAISGPDGGVIGNPQKVKENAQKGLNGVQGAANKKEMANPANAQGKTVEENIKNALEEITP